MWNKERKDTNRFESGNDIMSRILFPAVTTMTASLKLMVWELESMEIYPSVYGYALPHYYISAGAWEKVYTSRKDIGLPSPYWVRRE